MLATFQGLDRQERLGHSHCCKKHDPVYLYRYHLPLAFKYICHRWHICVYIFLVVESGPILRRQIDFQRASISEEVTGTREL